MRTLSKVLVFALATALTACGGASLVQTDCTDGQDNDGDGFIDDLDPGCPFNDGQLETPDPAQCNDGVDNDGDGLIDLADYGCETSTDAEEIDPTRACNDGVDNDGDGKADYVAVDIDGDGMLDPVDPGCDTPVDDDELNNPACSDSVDNDADGETDFPFEAGCDSANDDDEYDDCGTANPVACPQCADGIDNDGDGDIDAADLGCQYAADPDEFNIRVGECGPSVVITDISGTGDGTGTIDGPLPNYLTSPVCNGFGGEFAFTYTVTSGPVSLLITTDHPETTLDTVVYVRTVCQNPATELGCDDDSGSGHTSTVIVPLAEDDTTYYIVVDAFGPGSLGDFHLTVEERTALHGSCDPSDPAPCVPGLICRSLLPGDPTTCEYHVCGDALDNDGDGITDFPNEPGCTTLLDDTEDDTCPGAGCPECGDGIDNDMDGFTDFVGGDPGCEFGADGLELDECYPGKPISALDPVAGVTGTTVGETNDTSGSCGGADSPESVYALTVNVPLESITFDTDNTTTGTFDTILYVREGTCDSTSAQVGCNDNISSFNTHSAVTFTPTTGETYFVFVDSMWGAAGSFHVDVSGVILPGGVCDPSIPSFSCTNGYACQNPGAGFICAVADCNDTVDNDADGLLDWPNDPGCATQSDNDELDDCPSGPLCPACGNGIDDDTDGIIDFTGGDIGCTAAGDDNEIDECYPGSPVELVDANVGVTGNTAGAPNATGGSCGGTDSPELIYALRVNVPLTSLTLDTDNATTGFFDTVLYVREDVCDTGAEMACNDDISPSDQNSTVTFTPLEDHMYYIFVDSKWGGTGTFHLDVSGIIAAGGTCDPLITNFACVGGYACRESTPGATDWQCRIAHCNDGLDNDTDGFTDFPFDPGCATSSDDFEDFPNPITACSNGIDDDGDGFIDFAGGDAGCASAADNGEIDECVPGETVFDHPGGIMTGDTSVGGTSSLSSPSACDPGASTGTTPEDVWVFNNTNNLTDLRFSTAGSSFDTVLYVRYSACDVAGPASYCNNDAAGTFTSEVDIPAPAMGYYFAVVDGEWSAMGTYSLTITGTVATGGTCVAGDSNFVCAVGSACVGGVCAPAACNDTIDNDGDGDIDYPFDPGCTSISDASEADPAVLPQCANGIDDDGDGFIDFPADDSCGAASDDNEACTSFGTDGYGYSGCTDTLGAVPPCEDISTTGTLGPTGDDSSVTVTLPFTFDFYGVPQTTASLISNGKVGFLGTTSYSNTCTIETNTIAAYWDDLYPPSGGSVRYQTFGTAPNRHVTFQWNVPHITGGTFYDIRAVLYEGTNDIDVCYVDTVTLGASTDNGASATVGIQGSTAGLNYSCNNPIITSGLLIRYNHP